MRHPTKTLIVFWLALGAALSFTVRSDAPSERWVWPTAGGSFAIDGHGSLVNITPKGSERNLVAPGQTVPLLQLRSGGKWLQPDRAHWAAEAGQLTLQFSNATVTVVVKAKPTHLDLELSRIEAEQPIEIALWGPYPTTIGETIGEIVGVVRNRDDAVGIQALNAKTLGGYPNVENEIDGEFGADDTGYYPELPEELKKGQGFRGDVARPTAFGSVLQAYCRNRNQEQVIANWGHDRYRVPPFADGGVVGSRIALFVCPEPKALETIGAIELSEGLPHPMLDGEWGKTARSATASYLIVDFGENNIDRAIDMTRRAGLRYLYHSSPFESWGHFKLKPSLFPNGWNGFRTCVEKARKAGIRIGFHTLSNFITPTDDYVTPKPNRGLAVIGTAPLRANVDAATRDLPVSNVQVFTDKATLRTVRIGDELVRFGSVATNATSALLACERGAWGTTATAHTAGDPVGLLLDHEYNVFLGDAELSLEIARNIANFCNQTGARQLSFDGLEGNWASGYGQYGRTLFTKAWYDSLNEEARGRVINDASNPGHFNWHIFTRMNWGEPWYAGFRESQTLYRFKNQVLFQRNYMPHMLGWFALRPNTSLEDAEWLLARAAGFDAGFALATSLASTAQLEADPNSADTARQFGATSAILASISEWETARMANAFPAEIKARLRDNQREFHLQGVGKGAWDLREATVMRFNFPSKESKGGGFEFANSESDIPWEWTVTSVGKSPVSALTIEVDGHPLVGLKEVSIPVGGHLKYVGGGEAAITDGTWKELARVPIIETPTTSNSGLRHFQILGPQPQDAAFKVELRRLGAKMRVTGRL